MDRLPDWDKRLTDYLSAARDRAYEGRENICGVFAAGAVQAVTGRDILAEYQGRLHEVAEALEQSFDAEFPERPVALAQRGDLAFYADSVGVVVGGQAAFVGDEADGRPTLVMVPRAQWEKAWGVGHG